MVFYSFTFGVTKVFIPRRLAKHLMAEAQILGMRSHSQLQTTENGTLMAKSKRHKPAIVEDEHCCVIGTNGIGLFPSGRR
jgi:hypothetical protein